MNKSSITILLFLLIFSKNYSQFHKLPENIFSVKIKGSNQDYPVFNLSDKIFFSFDDLNTKKSSFYYKINHYDFEWKPSKILKSEYIDGYDDNLIESFDNSYNTLIDYTNYQISIPNKDLKLKISGNYSISIHSENGDFLFEKKFSVLNKMISTNIKIKKSSDLEKIDSHQNIDISVRCDNCNKFNGNSSDLKLVVIKNNNLNNFRVIEKPDYFLNNTLIYRDISFKGGNEFLNFDSSKINSTNVKVYKTELNDFYEIYLRTDIDRTDSFYQYNPDINGSFVINKNFNNPEIENDYSLVKFSFKPDRIDKKNRVFIIGEFNDYKITNKYELKLNNNIYKGEFKFKQGFYNYKYLSLETGGRIKKYSGNFWETQNIYIALLYHKKLTEKYYKLISISETSSVNIKN
ncbi:MAG: DUF5103 domain-containing protein [Flavobacteriaceae bacterium]|jgi:hypothetical protein|nr:DUF5103 domain-containing protein [Flavobacteriaceae bacterium]MBT4960971.1 DUF5103 domain-containing protein [Flavobacteriaceae bacterium]MBT5232961.1 DUF5103 domain-containing protein [Flavobacteriaceae bacterium]MDG1967013.1 DUF5103 domain-containing protein [Flavobacteriaceae bacterium]|tara:strand:- start:8010 stop:9224 length:1215 start_codon:yes stop_codon:yes gene_type:complete